MNKYKKQRQPLWRAAQAVLASRCEVHYHPVSNDDEEFPFIRDVVFEALDLPRWCKVIFAGLFMEGLDNGRRGEIWTAEAVAETAEADGAGRFSIGFARTLLSYMSEPVRAAVEADQETIRKVAAILNDGERVTDFMVKQLLTGARAVAAT